MTQLARELQDKSWKRAWDSILFRRKLIVGFILLAMILAAFPAFFTGIESRPGVALNDWVLYQLPVVDVSVLIFSIIWASSLLMLLRCIKDPGILLPFIWSYILLCLFRVLTISLFALEPPKGLIPLTDPLANAFYGAHFVTRDLFFSGHTSSVFLIALSLKKKAEKIITFIASGVIACLLLLQHVHYTIDVVAAPFLTYIVYWGGQKIGKVRGEAESGVGSQESGV